MVQFSVSIEGTHGLTWSLWRQLMNTVEELGFAGLYLTDHFPHGQAEVELIVGLTYLATGFAKPLGSYHNSCRNTIDCVHA